MEPKCSECDEIAIAEAFDRVEKRWFFLCQECVDRERPDKVEWIKEKRCQE